MFQDLVQHNAVTRLECVNRDNLPLDVAVALDLRPHHQRVHAAMNADESEHVGLAGERHIALLFRVSDNVVEGC